MSLPFPFNTGQTLAKEPIDETLMDENYRQNIESLSVQIDAISGGGGGGGDLQESFAKVLSGGHDDSMLDWKRRWKYSQLAVMPAQTIEASELESEDPNVRFFYEEELVNTGTSAGDSRHYLGWRQVIEKDVTVYFKVKKNENYFTVGFSKSARCDALEVRINGSTPSSLGVTNRNGDAADDDIDATAAVTIFQFPENYYDLNGSEEVIVSIKNNDSASKDFWLEYIEIGYKKKQPTIDHSLEIKAGKANVNGAEVEFNEGSFSFTESGESNGYGYDGAVKIDSSGVLTKTEGPSPAQTECKPGEEIAFSGSVTSLEVKSNFYFQDTGICLLQMPRGSKHWFSYGDRALTSVQGSTLDEIIWQSKPQENITPATNFDDSAGIGESIGDVSVTRWGNASINITSSNQYIDWTVTIDGNLTTHAATVPIGYYSADIVRLGDAMIRAMRAVKDIQGCYTVDYDNVSKKWSVGVNSPEVEEIEFLFSTGVNSANSIGTTIGFSTDQTGGLSYNGSTEVNHLCVRSMSPDNEYIEAEDSRFKYSSVNIAGNLVNKDAESRMGSMSMRKMAASGGQMWTFSADEDCVGAEFTFLSDDSGTQVTFYIDGRGPIYGINTQSPDWDSVSVTARAKYVKFFVAFPRGSKTITMFNEINSSFQHTVINEEMTIHGSRQYFTKPPHEELSTDERILKSYMIKPLQIYAKKYGHNGSNLYSPNGTTHIGTVAETGTWSGVADTSGFNRNVRQTTVDGSYQEWEVTLSGDGGGFGFMGVKGNGENKNVSMYTSTAAINESTDLIANTHLEWGNDYIHGLEHHYIYGVRAGTYNVRIKANSGIGERYRTHGLVVYDSVLLEENANSTTDVNSTGSGVIYPIHTVVHQSSQDDGSRVSPGLLRNQHKEGYPGFAYNALSTQSFINQEDATGIMDKELAYYQAYSISSQSGVGRVCNFHGRGMVFKSVSASSRNTNMLAFLDGTQTVNTVNETVQVSGGSGPTARDNTFTSFSKFYQLTITHSASDTYNMSDTRGLRDGQRIRLRDSVLDAWETFTVENIVTNTSFDTVETPSIITQSDVDMIDFSGFHSAEYRTQSTTDSAMSCFEIDPLPIQPSKIRRRSSRSTKTDVVTNKILDAVGTDGSYPLHKDGIQGNSYTSSVQVTADRTAGSYDIDENLKDLPDIDLKLTSTREIIEDIEPWEF